MLICTRLFSTRGTLMHLDMDGSSLSSTIVSSTFVPPVPQRPSINTPPKLPGGAMACMREARKNVAYRSLRVDHTALPRRMEFPTNYLLLLPHAIDPESSHG